MAGRSELMDVLLRPDSPPLPPTQPLLQPFEKPQRKHSGPGIASRSSLDAPSGVKRTSAPSGRPAQAPVAQARQKDKFVPLPRGDTDSAEEGTSEDTVEPSNITVYCLGERFDRKQLESLLQEYKGVTCNLFPDVVHASMADEHGSSTLDAYFFQFGVVIMFGFDKAQETDMLNKVARPVLLKPYQASRQEVDVFQFMYSHTVEPHIKNDVFTINKRQGKTHTVRLAIAHALAQSSKLSVYELQVGDLVEDTKHLPKILAETGKVAVAPKQVAQLIGRVFLQNANVNLLSSVLDTPEFFWSEPDHLLLLYERACEYLELAERVNVLNTRFQVLQEMLDMLRDQQNTLHAARLEIIIIWLLVVDCILMLFQLLSLFGVIGG